MAKKPTYEELKKRIRVLEMEAEKRRLAEDALRQSETRLFQIVQGSSIPTFVIDDKHVITHCNRAFENLTAISAGDFLGTQKQWVAFYSSERPVMADLIVDNAPKEEYEKYYNGRFRKSPVIEGAYEAEGFFSALGESGKWLFFTAAPLKNAEGRISGAVETLQDITERKRAEEAVTRSERRLRALLDFLPYPTVVFQLDGRVYYLNPAFTEIFGWTLEELAGKTIPYVPPGLEGETTQMIRKLFEERVVLRHETKRLTKNGRVLDVVMRGAVYSVSPEEPAGELVILRDVTREKRMAQNNEAILRISTALPEYPDLEDLLDYISSEVKRLLGTEGSLVVLLDRERNELFFLGAAYDDTATQRRVKEIRFPVDKLMAGKVIKTGEPIIVSDTSRDPDLHLERDKKLGYHTRNLLLVPLRSSDRIIGVLSAINKKEGMFDQSDVELLSMIAGTVALSIENARFSEELKKAYREVSSLNRAKGKVINHLSHELKTPLSVLSASLNTLVKRVETLDEKSWKPTVERMRRNLDRLLEIQEEVDDIIQEKRYRTHEVLSLIIEQCADELQSLIAEQIGEGSLVEDLRKRIDDLFGPKEAIAEQIKLHEFVGQRLEELGPSFSHRRLNLVSSLEPVPYIFMPLDPLRKVFDGLIKNAVENTPDEGRIEVMVRKKEDGAELVVRDFGVGIPQEAKKRIFEGFFTTRNTMDYSSKRPFDFNAGGKGADLLRMKIFSERHHFQIKMESSRCLVIPREDDTCPGCISACASCNRTDDCLSSGGTTFWLYFPPAPKVLHGVGAGRHR